MSITIALSKIRLGESLKRGRYQTIEDDVAELAEVDVVLELGRALVQVERLDVVEGLLASLTIDTLRLSWRPLETNWLRTPGGLFVVSWL